MRSPRSRASVRGACRCSRRDPRHRRRRRPRPSRHRHAHRPWRRGRGRRSRPDDPSRRAAAVCRWHRPRRRDGRSGAHRAAHRNLRSRVSDRPRERRRRLRVGDRQRGRLGVLGADVPHQCPDRVRGHASRTARAACLTRRHRQCLGCGDGARRGGYGGLYRRQVGGVATHRSAGRRGARERRTGERGHAIGHRHPRQPARHA